MALPFRRVTLAIQIADKGRVVSALEFLTHVRFTSCGAIWPFFSR